MATDRALLIIGRGSARRLPRDLRFGTPTGIHHKIKLDHKYKVHRQYFPEISAAGQALHGLPAPGNPTDSDQR